MTPCNYDPRLDVQKPLGMFHCPLCGEMVVAGYPHPDDSGTEGPPKQDVDLPRTGGREEKRHQEGT